MNPQDVEQGTAEWRQCRTGFVTASRIADVLRKPKRGQIESTTRKAYIAQIVSERLTGKPIEDTFESWDLKRGKTLEPRARAEYELRCKELVQTVGFVEHPSLKWAGASPDALVGADGLAQIKCPRLHVHLDYLKAGIVPSEYKPQMLFELACTGRKWSDFVSYAEDLPDHLQLFVVRLQRNEGEIAMIEEEVNRFLFDVDEYIKGLPRKKGETALESQLEASLRLDEQDFAPLK